MAQQEMVLSARYSDGEWVVRRRDRGAGMAYRFDDVYEVIGWAPFNHAEEDGADVTDYRVRILFEDQELCPIGRHGPQALHSAWKDESMAWGERAVEHVLTTGYTGEPYVALHQINYPFDGAATFRSVQLPPTAAGWTLRHLTHLVENGVFVDRPTADLGWNLCSEELPSERLPGA